MLRVNMPGEVTSSGEHHTTLLAAVFAMHLNIVPAVQRLGCKRYVTRSASETTPRRNASLSSFWFVHIIQVFWTNNVICFQSISCFWRQVSVHDLYNI